MQKVTDNIYVETGFRGCNTSFVVTTEGVVVIDTPMVPQEAQKWRQEAAKFGPILYVINTEPHTDHASGNYWFGAKVIAHEGTREALLEAKASDLAAGLKTMAPDALPLDPAFRYRLPEITFTEDLTLYLGKHTFHLINMPGHTASETAVYVPEEKTVFTGDNLNLRVPIFVKSLPYEWLESLKRLQQLEVDKVVPGHGEVSGKACIAPMSEGVQYWIQAVRSAIDRGWSLEETLEKVTMVERYPMAQNSFMKNMTRNSVADLYRSLKRA
jgi:cyclase